MLPELAHDLRTALGVQQKREIQAAARHLPDPRGGPWGAATVRIGDDTAAIPDGEGFLLLAAEGMWPELVAREPRFAGYCAVMVNASDVYAMGGRPLAIVDALFATSAAAAEPILRGIADGAERFGLPVVGGHTNLHSPYAGLAAAVLGRARRLLTSFDARPGDDLIAAIDLRGQMHPRHPFWNASVDGPVERLRADYAVLPRIAEDGLAMAAKDISMGGLAGTALMLIEASGVGATLSLDAVPRPAGVAWATWLLAFPSYGFLLSVPSAHSDRVRAAFAARDIAAAVVGRVDDSRRLALEAGGERVTVWDLAGVPLTGFGVGRAVAGGRVVSAAAASRHAAGGERPERELPAAPRRIRIGMPHLDAAGLSEGWLFRYAGDLHWEAIARRLEVATDEIRGEGGRRLYPTVVALRARYGAPPSAIVENDVLDASIEVVPCGRACAHGRVVAAFAGRGAARERRLTLELLTTFAAREAGGAMRMAPPGGWLARRWMPEGGPRPTPGSTVAPIFQATTPEPEIARLARLARAARRGEVVDDPWLTPRLARAEGPPLGELTYEPSPYTEYNGAGLLYFASYVGIADASERLLVRRLDLAPAGRTRGRDWALAAPAVRRDVFFYENLPLGASLDAALLAFDADEQGVTTHVRLRRGAGAGDGACGRPMADVITRRVFFPQAAGAVLQAAGAVPEAAAAKVRP